MNKINFFIKISRAIEMKNLIKTKIIIDKK